MSKPSANIITIIMFFVKLHCFQKIKIYIKNTYKMITKGLIFFIVVEREK